MTSPTIEQILKEECEQVERSRSLRLDANAAHQKAEDSLIGLSFSGGGIRSATFNLGVLQAFAKERLLRYFDYISTVSGGGYISSWLMGWMYHQQVGIKKIEEYLADQPTAPRLERPEVRFLRAYSNYLTPRKGLLGADFWAFIGTYLRNMLLNQMFLVLWLLSLLLIPRCILYLFHLFEILEHCLDSYTGIFDGLKYSQHFALMLGVLFALVAVVFIGRNLGAIIPAGHKSYPWFAQQKWIQGLIVIPLFLAAAMITYGMGLFLTSYHILAHPYSRVPLLGALLYSTPWAVAAIVRWLTSRKLSGSAREPSGWLMFGSAIPVGAVAGFLLIPFSRLLMDTIPWHGEGDVLMLFPNYHVLTFGTPAFVLIMLLAGVLHVGLMGRKMRDGDREWWARLGGTLGIYSLCWLAFFLISIYFPKVLSEMSHRQSFSFTAGLAWVASTLYGVLFAKSAKTYELLPDASTREKIFGYIAKFGPYVFIVGFLLILSLVDARIANALSGNHQTVGELQDKAFYPWGVTVVCLGCFITAMALSWRVDVNEFSIHYLYRNRLVRCYLGASAPDRKPQPYTGFSEDDDVPLANLQIPIYAVPGVDDRPLPILNTSLNVVRGKELALQTRKARSFAITPLYLGFTRPLPGSQVSEAVFGSTKEVGAKRPDTKQGARLGTAMAISGAAASPNMGSYSAPDLAFLMTLFDVRLGWWLANPKGSLENWHSTSPTFGFFWLLKELLGATNDDSDYVYLSDGGHFENLGIYELVRRRCKLIVASDASCDSAYGFSDLHNAMERCRTDFGIEIEMTADESGKLKPTGQPPRAAAHFAVGKIHYVPGNRRADGVLIYLKPALLEADPADLLGYSSRNSAFPNDTTANQWFDESHFENYRAMGEATGRAALDTVAVAIQRLLHK